MRIIVLDDGISRERYRIPELIFDYEVTDSGEIKIADKEVSPVSHGSTCSAILAYYLEQWDIVYELCSIRVIDAETGRGDISRLLAGLKWCETQSPCILHMSLGSELVRDEAILHSAICRLYRKGFKKSCCLRQLFLKTVRNSFHQRFIYFGKNWKYLPLKSLYLMNSEKFMHRIILCMYRITAFIGKRTGIIF